MGGNEEANNNNNNNNMQSHTKESHGDSKYVAKHEKDPKKILGFSMATLSASSFLLNSPGGVLFGSEMAYRDLKTAKTIE